MEKVFDSFPVEGMTSLHDLRHRNLVGTGHDEVQDVHVEVDRIHLQGKLVRMSIVRVTMHHMWQRQVTFATEAL